MLDSNKFDKKSLLKLIICQGRKKIKDHFKCKSSIVFISYPYIYCFSKLYLWPTLLIPHQSSFWFSCYDLNFPRLNFRAINRLAGLGKDFSALWSQWVYKVVKGSFFSESIDAFVIYSNTWTFYFPESYLCGRLLTPARTLSISGLKSRVLKLPFLT